MTSLWELKQNAWDDLKDNIDHYKYWEDAVSEIADSWIPVYNGQLLEMCLDDLTLGYVDDWHGGEVTDIYTIIQWNLYSELSNHLHEQMSEIEKCDICDLFMVEGSSEEDAGLCQSCYDELAIDDEA